MKLNLFTASFLLLAACASAHGQRYCNPLPMPVGQGGNAGGDVTVIEEGGKYYMCCTGGGMWVSDDLLNWDFHAVEHIPVAPDLVKYNGKFYLTGNTDHVYVADNPLGPYTDLGLFKNTGPVELGWNGGFDTKIFIDDDNQPYLFWPGRGISGIYGVKLDPNDLTTFVGTPTHLFGFNPMHAWERYGEMNEYPGVAWIEGPWVIKRKGIYYLEYSASGTQWKTYAEGYYTATSPLGPYTYAPNNPLLRKTEGLVTGTAHGSIVKLRDKDEFRGTLSAVWIILNGILFVSDIIGGSFDAPTVRLTLISAAVLAAALVTGNLISKKMSRKVFLILTYVLMLISGISLLIK